MIGRENCGGKAAIVFIPTSGPEDWTDAHPPTNATVQASRKLGVAADGVPVVSTRQKRFDRRGPRMAGSGRHREGRLESGGSTTANPEHLAILEQGAEAWNAWREENPEVRPDLSDASLSGIDFTSDPHAQNPIDFEVDFHRANLRGADFSDAFLLGADLSEADLSETILMRANVSFANLREADLTQTNFWGADLHNSDLTLARASRASFGGSDLGRVRFTGANLTQADMREATLVRTEFGGANVSGCWVHGISVWGIKVDEKTVQSDLVITDHGEPTVTVDNLEVAQFVYLMLHNEKIRDVLNTIGEKGVLILGRFTPERKAVLDSVRERLRSLGYVPMVFDFEKPTQRDFTETVKTLAGMSRFIVADITNPKSSPLELQATVPDYAVPLVPILHEDEQPFSMFADLQNKYAWVLPVLKYDTVESLTRALKPAIVDPALQLADRLLMQKAEGIRERHIREYQERE